MSELNELSFCSVVMAFAVSYLCLVLECPAVH